MLMEGTDFILGPDCPPQAIGHKALGVSLSDLAAMGARPEAAFVAVSLPRRGGDQIGRGLLEGVGALAARHGVTLAGGDTNAWDGPLVISTTAIGSVLPGKSWRRDNARPGDLIVVTGAFGGSLLGRHLAVEPRCREAQFIAEQFTVHAAIDCSDGLSLDLGRMMAASGTRGVVRLADVPIHPDALTMSRQPGDGKSPLDHALTDGEDFELIMAMPPDAARTLVAAAASPSLGLPITVIGAVEAGSGLVAIAADGSRRSLEPQGFLHDFDS
jgi:thiamine-monophosphate kinase